MAGSFIFLQMLALFNVFPCVLSLPQKIADHSLHAQGEPVGSELMGMLVPTYDSSASKGAGQLSVQSSEVVLDEPFVLPLPFVNPLSSRYVVAVRVKMPLGYARRYRYINFPDTLQAEIPGDKSRSL